MPTRSSLMREGSAELTKYYEEPKYNAAFDRCVDVMTRLLQKYGPPLIEQWETKQCDSEIGVIQVSECSLSECSPAKVA